MAKFTYSGDDGRVYPTLPAPANTPTPGGTYTLDDDPGDGRWTPAQKKSAQDKAEEQ